MKSGNRVPSRPLLIGLALPLLAGWAASLAAPRPGLPEVETAGMAAPYASPAASPGSSAMGERRSASGAGEARAGSASTRSSVVGRRSSVGAGAGAAAQDFPFAPYHGRFTFVRIRYDPAVRGFRGFGRGEPPWHHDYPRAERHLMKILDELTYIRPYLENSNVMWASDPELFKFPVAYVSEPGFWTQTEEEVAALSAYIHKGGFLIFDDFRGPDLYNFEREIRRVLPGARLVELDVSHPIFHSFFEIESLDLTPPTFQGYQPVYYGIYEDNDPDKRLVAVANYNNDIGEYWEWSDTGFLAIDLSNEAYKLGVNYIVYAMTH